MISFHCISDILKHIPYGQDLKDQLKSDPDADGLHNKDGNAFTDALIEHFESKQLSSPGKTNSTITTVANGENGRENDPKPEQQKSEVKNHHQLLPKKASSHGKGLRMH